MGLRYRVVPLAMIDSAHDWSRVILTRGLYPDMWPDRGSKAASGTIVRLSWTLREHDVTR